jgi:hypothetical protein
MVRLPGPRFAAIPRWAAGLGLSLLIVTLGASSSGPAPAGVSVKRGRYLSHAVCECFECHSPLQDNDLVQPIAAKLGAGDILDKKTRHVAPNITPDEETGAGRWSDEQLVRAIRDGVGHDSPLPSGLASSAAVGGWRIGTSGPDLAIKTEEAVMSGTAREFQIGAGGG